MKLLCQTLYLALALALSLATPSNLEITMADHHADHYHDGHVHHHDDHQHVAHIDCCEGIQFDAIAPDAQGINYFFKGDHMWRGFHGPSELVNGSYKELEEHHPHLGHTNAALCLHPADNVDHKHVFFFLDDKVFSYHDHTLEEGFPKNISEVFPGIPSHIDAAVGCPMGECVRDSVIFFKGCEVFHYDTYTKEVKNSHWTHLPNCTSAMRWLNHYYCFHEHQFTKFHPVTGAVTSTYPKDARDYFMKCPNFGNYFLCEDVRNRDGWHAIPIAEAFKEVKSDVDVVFSHASLLYIIKGDQVFVYKSGKQYELVEGYPKALKEELGIEGPLDAAFVCGEYPVLHVTKGKQMFDSELSATQRSVINEARLPFAKLDATICDPNGIKVFVGTEYFQYETPRLLAFSRIRPQPHKMSLEDVWL